MKNVIFNLIYLPCLILILPATYKGILICLIICCVIYTILINQYGFTVKQINTNNILLASGLIDIIIMFLFYIRWMPSGMVTAVAAKIHLSNSVFLFICSIVLGVLAFRGLNCFIDLIIDYFIHFSDRNLVKWLKKGSLSLKEKFGISFMLSVLFWIFQGQLPIYTDIDNYGISMILNGLYDTDNYCCFVSPILAKMVSIVDWIIPTADGFVVLMELTMAVAICLLLFTLLSFGVHKINLLIIWLLLVVCNFNLNIFHINFTVYSGILTCIALIGLYAFVKKKVGYIAGIVSIVVFLMGALWRFNAQLLFVPFIALVILAEFICKRKAVIPYQKRIIAVVILMIVCMGGSKITSNIVSNSDIYSAAVDYNNARSRLFDYPLADWDAVGDKLEAAGISKNDYYSIQDTVLADTDIITTEYMQQIHDVAKEEGENILDTLADKMDDVWYMINSDMSIYLQIVCLMFILFWLLLFSDCMKMRILELLFSYIGTIVIVLYFAATGRIPDRVMQTILFADWFVVGSVLFADKWQYNFSVKNVRQFLFGFVISAAIFSYISADKIEDGSVFDSFTAKTGQSDNGLVKDDAKYVWGTYDYNTYIAESYWQNNKLPSMEFMHSNITDGKWVYGQVCYNNYLSSIDLCNPMQALLDENVYYIGNGERSEMILTFLREHYDSNIVIQEIDNIEGIPVWQFIR